MTDDRRFFESRSSGPRWNAIVDSMLKRFWERERFFEQLLTTDGYPPFNDPLLPREQYDRLAAWRAGGDQRYWGSAEAQKALEMFSLQYGQLPPLSPLISQAPPRII